MFVFFYASAHMMTYVGIDYRFDWSSIGDDIVKKKFIFAGFLAWLLLVPLALTSSKRMIRLLIKAPARKEPKVSDCSSLRPPKLNSILYFEAMRGKAFSAISCSTSFGLPALSA